MASGAVSALPILLLLLLLPCISAELICEKIPQDLCAFAISSSSRRCVLERVVTASGSSDYQCTTSEVVVERMSDVIETDECVRACGLDRNAVGISSDAFLEPGFTAKLCSPACYQNCPNIVDLYFNLAAGEGVFLPDLCEARRNPHRSMVEFLSSGAASGPSSSASITASSPAPSPSP